MAISDFEGFTDEELIEKSRNGNDLALDVLISRYIGLVRQKAFRFFLVGADKEDLLQEGLIGLFKATRDYKPELSVPFKSFAETCVKRQLATAIKAATRLKHSPLNNSVSLNRPLFDEDDDSELFDIISESASHNPEDFVINKEQYNTIGEKIKKHLSKFELKVLEYYLCGKSYQEIATLLEKPQKAIDNALQRIRHKVETFSADCR